MTYSIIQKSQIEGDLRIDAEYYQPEYLMIRKRLESAPTLGSLFRKIVRDPMGYGFTYESSGIPYYRIDDLLCPFLSDDPVFISEATHEKLKRTQLKYGDLIMAVRGATIGRLGLFTNKLPSNISPNVIILRPRDTTWSKYFALFLSSRLGKEQIEWMIAGTGQPTITTDQIRELKIPINEKLKEQIDAFYDETISEFSASGKLYSQAENLLLEELGLKNYHPVETLSYVVDFSDTAEAERIDADFFQPKYDEIISLIQKYGAKNLLEVVENIPAGFNSVSKPQETFKYIELANINSSLGIIDGFSEVLGEEAPSRAKRILKKNDVVISSIGGSLDKIALVGKEHEESLASTGFFQFRSKNILPEVFLVLAKSPVLQLQLEKYVAGTILAAIPNEALKSIVVPDLPMETQQKIADLVRKSHEARKKSKELLEEAKRKVEEMIEGEING